MKNLKNIGLTVCMLLVIHACKEDEKGQYPIHGGSPGKVTSARVEENFAGGALIVYDIPKEEDALYVRARYVLDDGTPMELKSSVYTDRVTIVGIGRSRELPVILTVVDRSQNESEPVTVMAYPLDSPLFEIARSMIVRDDFGGIALRWVNPEKLPVIIDVATPDNLLGLVPVDRFYSNAPEGKANVRGQNPVETIFSITISDRWGNVTEPRSGSYTPLYEELFDKSKFRRWNPPGLPYIFETASGYQIERLWDNEWYPGELHPASYVNYMTFDMGQTGKISRFKVYQTYGNQIYAFACPKRFELWGSTTPDVTDDTSSWQLIGYFESFKPSGLPTGQVSDEDIQFACVNGEDFEVENCPNVRYIWFRSLETWGQSDRLYMHEMTFWGEIQE